MEPTHATRIGPRDAGDDGSALTQATVAQTCCDDPWEAAYLRFETPEQEICKFRKRLLSLGADVWPRYSAIVELFCGRGNGLHALEQLGFSQVEGVDLSANLLAQYRGNARVRVGDCRQIPIEDGSKDIIVVQGGLHHLLVLPDDLKRTLSEVHRVLKDGGLLVAVEPWMTPFLTLVHAICRIPAARKLSVKINALAIMIDHERVTYEAWLARPRMILDALDLFFEPVILKTTSGKLRYVGRKRPSVSTSHQRTHKALRWFGKLRGLGGGQSTYHSVDHSKIHY
jgi:SAM-dependent methyltransferase